MYICRQVFASQILTAISRSPIFTHGRRRSEYLILSVAIFQYDNNVSACRLIVCRRQNNNALVIKSKIKEDDLTRLLLPLQNRLCGRNKVCCSQIRSPLVMMIQWRSTAARQREQVNARRDVHCTAFPVVAGGINGHRYYNNNDSDNQRTTWPNEYKLAYTHIHRKAGAAFHNWIIFIGDSVLPC